MMLAAVRVRGPNSTRRNAADTMDSLRLHTRHNCVLLANTDANRGMLRQAKDFIAYGDVDADTIAALLAKRGRVDGGRLADNLDAVGYEDIDALAADVADGTVPDGLQLPFRLSPPRNGFRDTKRHTRQGGSLGERDDMDALLQRMI